MPHAALQDRRASPEPEQPEAEKASQVSPGLHPRPSRARDRIFFFFCKFYSDELLKRQRTRTKKKLNLSIAIDY